MRARTCSMLVAGAALVAACGGGGGDVPSLPTDVVPDSASASPGGMTDWLMALAATAPEDQEALDISRFTPPRPDDTEPVPLK
jgi:hypothetical protein